ncbi:OmpA family protein [Hymenobacter monticola]|uniref:OmpA family protein n=1 Tax=Hymenobacter monticola TaxID=1705399 RepID=A0ABY4B728_9BACT|nr:OmpA family protein [Hymenobacter monticola]UOE33568.1 OmpA family protein [Hymenobacter monticola]
MLAPNRCLRLFTAPSSGNSEKPGIHCGWWNFLSLVLMLGMVGLQACQAIRPTVPVTNSIPASVVAEAKTERPITVRGKVFSIKDSSTIVPGMELIFRDTYPNAVEGVFRVLTGPEGAYKIDLNAGHIYEVALNKDGRKVEIQQYAPPGVLGDSSFLVKDFYTTYIDDCCSDDFMSRIIYFDTNRSALRSNSLTQIAEFIGYFRQMKVDGAIVLVSGHAEPSEVPLGHFKREQYLTGIGWERAKATCAYLANHGIPANKLFMVSYGGQRPVSYNYSPEERQLNRRAELRFSSLEYLSWRSNARVVPYKKPALPARRPRGSKLGSHDSSESNLPAKQKH